jgi:uncharacterized protein (TIGR03437 family)
MPSPRLCFVLVMLAASLSAQRFPTAVRQQDLNYVATQVPKLHANFFFQLDPAAYQKAVAALQAQISTLTDAEFYVQLTALVALAGDAHTAIYLNNGTAISLGFQQFPIQFRWLDDGIFVTAAAPAYAQALGARLVQVGDFPIDQVIQKLGTVIPHGNDAWLHYEAQQYLTGQQVLQGLDLLPASATSALTFQTLTGNQFTLQVGTAFAGALQNAVDPLAGPLPDFLQQTGLNYWYSYSAQNRMVYFKYNKCANDPNNPFAAFTAAVLATVDSQPVDTFVFDFRGNTGGDAAVIDPLLNGLLTRVSALFANPQFRIYDVIDQGTFSSGMDNAMAIKSGAVQAAPLLPGVDLSKKFIVIGEPTGGKPAEYGEVVVFNLPGSGLNGQYSTKYFPNPAGIPDLASFLPDIPISTRSTDFFARYDPVMGAILGRTNGAPPVPSGGLIVVNGASFRVDQGIAPGSYATAFGNFSQPPDQVTVNGVVGRLAGGTTAQQNFIVPSSVSPGMATISMSAGGTELARGQAAITVAGPGIFVLQGANPSQPGAVENQDSSVNNSLNPATQGSVIQIFATGDGQLSGGPQVFFADTTAQVLFSGETAQYPGLWQINAVVPSTASGQVPVYVVAGNLTSNAVTIAVH